MNPLEYKRWIEDAESELESARILLEGVTEKTITHGIGANIVEHCQQALEKVLKAVFLKRNINQRQPRIHILSILLTDSGLQETAPQFAAEFLDTLDKDYRHVRYPNSSVLPFSTDLKLLKNLYTDTKEVFRWIILQE